MRDLSKEDLEALARLGLRRAPVQDTALASRVNLDMEFKDTLKASKFTLKFVAFKTPSTKSDSKPLPKELYFSFKFFTFVSCMTEPVALHNSGNDVKIGTHYYLVLPDTLRLMSRSSGKDKVADIEQVLDSALQQVYEVPAAD